MKNLRYYIDLIEAELPPGSIPQYSNRPEEPATNNMPAAAAMRPPAAAPAAPAPQTGALPPGKNEFGDNYNDGTTAPLQLPPGAKPRQLAPVDPELKKFQEFLLTVSPETYKGLLGPYGADGRFGPNTRKAIEQYLKNNDKFILRPDPELKRILDKYKGKITIPTYQPPTVPDRTPPATPGATPTATPTATPAEPPAYTPTGYPEYDKTVEKMRATIAAGGPGAADAKVSLDAMLKNPPGPKKTEESLDDRTLSLIRGIQL
jgi:hypothetical protein